MKIHCPNCHYEGRAKAKEQRATRLELILLGISFLLMFSMLMFVTFFAMIAYPLYAIYRSKKICPKCRWEDPIPLKDYQAQQAKEDS